MRFAFRVMATFFDLSAYVLGASKAEAVATTLTLVSEELDEPGLLEWSRSDVMRRHQKAR